MPSHGRESGLSLVARRQEIASILARGVIRLHRHNRTCGFTPESGTQGRNSLELLRETRLSVSRTRGLRPRDDGDNA